ARRTEDARYPLIVGKDNLEVRQPRRSEQIDLARCALAACRGSVTLSDRRGSRRTRADLPLWTPSVERWDSPHRAQSDHYELSCTEARHVLTGMSAKVL